MKNCKDINTPLVLNEKFKKEDGAKKVDVGIQSIYITIIGCLLYLTTTRHDIIYMFATSLLSRFMQAPNELHFKVAK